MDFRTALGNATSSHWRGRWECAAVHRSHFAIPADRAQLARNATGFNLSGAVVLDDHVRGLDPAVAETALRTGSA